MSNPTKKVLIKVITEILDYRIDEIGYADRDDIIVDMCLEALPNLRKDYDWEDEDCE